MTATFNLTKPVTHPPETAPSRRLTPDKWPKPAAARATLAAAGIDATDLAQLLRAVAAHGWVWRIGGGGRHSVGRCWAAVVVPWLDRDQPWSDCWGNGLTEALAGALALAIANPPPDESAADAAIFAADEMTTEVAH
jgi:hypothetical protein